MKLETCIDWATTSEDVLKKYSIGSYCGTLLSAMPRLAGRVDNVRKQPKSCKLPGNVRDAKSAEKPKELT